MDCEEEDQAATISNGPNVRTGTVPVSYDPEHKKMLWYYFVAAAMKAEEVVSVLPDTCTDRLILLKPWHPSLNVSTSLRRFAIYPKQEVEACKAMRRQCICVA